MPNKFTTGLLKLHAKYPQDIVTPDGHYTVARTLPQPTIAVAVANARRLVACWNACEGIDTDDLDAHSVNIIHKLHDDAAKRVLSERDELLAAVNRLLSWERTGHQTRSEDVAFAQQALAKATGGGEV